jgi:hypothetical protein
MVVVPRFLRRKQKYANLDCVEHRHLEGDGELLHGNKKHNCDFRYVVEPEGRGKFEFIINGVVPISKTSVGTRLGYGRFLQFRFKGTSSSGYAIYAPSVSISGYEIGGIFARTKYTATAKQVTIRRKSYRPKPKYGLYFAVTNLDFLGLHVSYNPETKRYASDRFDVIVGGRNYRFILDERIEAIRASQKLGIRNRITAWIHTEIERISQVDEVVEVVDMMCSMIGIVSGKMTNAMYWRVYDKIGRLVFERYENRASGIQSGTGAEIIDNFYVPAGLAKYIESCFDEYKRLEISHRLRSFRGFMTAANEPGSIQDYLLRVIPGTELISSQIILKSTDKKVFIKRKELEWKNLSEKLDHLHQNYLKFYSATKWSAVQHKLASGIRNPLFHQGHLVMGPLDSFGKIRFIHMIALRLYLKLVGYRGNYMDFTSGYKVRKA